MTKQNLIDFVRTTKSPVRRRTLRILKGLPEDKLPAFDFAAYQRFGYSSMRWSREDFTLIVEVVRDHTVVDLLEEGSFYDELQYPGYIPEKVVIENILSFLETGELLAYHSTHKE